MNPPTDRTHPAQQLVGQTAVVVARTTHFDRAGESACTTIFVGELVAIEDANLAVIDAQGAAHVRCPIAQLHRLDHAINVRDENNCLLESRLLAAEELVRDYHSTEKPLELRWLTKAEALALFANLRDDNHH
jgi:hypothetical protein